MTWVQPPGLCSAAQPCCGDRGGVSRTMQFFKSSLILLVAFRVALYHDGDLGLAQGSAPVLSEEGLLEVAKFPLQPPCHPPPSPHHLRESGACRLLGASLTPPLARTLGKPLSLPEYLRCRLESLPGLKLSSVRVHPGESRHPHL